MNIDDTSLTDAIERDDLSALAALIDRNPALLNARLERPDRDRVTPLGYAAGSGRIAVCRWLVERGADVYTNPFDSYPPVMHAAWNDHQEVVDYFLREIPEQAAGTNKLGVTLVLAARQGWTDLVRAHLSRDPLSVYLRGWIGESALHWPAHNGFVEIVELLLDAGLAIETDEIGLYGGKPLHWASEHAPTCVARLLQRGADPNCRVTLESSSSFGMTPLHWNATQRDDCAEATELLLAAGADPAAVDGKGRTAHDVATERGLKRIIAALARYR